MIWRTRVSARGRCRATRRRCPASLRCRELKDRELTAFPEKDYTECTINIGFAPLNTVDPNEREAFNMLNAILASSALTSRIGVELRDKQGLIYGLKSELWCPVRDHRILEDEYQDRSEECRNA